MKETLNCSAVADWFNQQGVPVGPYCRRREVRRGMCAMVRRYYGNSIPKGMPCRGTRHTVKHHETGRRVSVKNPKGPTYRECPHLAHLDPAEFDELNVLLKAKNDKYRRKLVNGIDPRGRCRASGRFPGPARLLLVLRLALRLGRQRGDGEPDVLRQPGLALLELVRLRWPLGRQRLVSVITAELYQLDGFEAQFTEMVRSAQRDRSGGTADGWSQLLSDEAALAKEKENFNNAIKMFGARPTLLEQLNDIETREKELVPRRHRLEHLQTKTLELPESIGELRQRMEDEFKRLAVDSPEFGDLMRQLVPEFYVYLVRLVDGGHPLSRAKVKLTLAGIVPDAQLVPGLGEMLTRELTLDLFEKPPQRERIREEVVRLAAERIPQRQIAARLTEEKPKLAAVQKVLALDQKMKELGLETPYVLVTEPPEDYPKLRRHKNPKYRFQPREGYQRPAI